MSGSSAGNLEAYNSSSSSSSTSSSGSSSKSNTLDDINPDDYKETTV